MPIRKHISKVSVTQTACSEWKLRLHYQFSVLFCLSKKVPKKETTKAKFELHFGAIPNASRANALKFHTFRGRQPHFVYACFA
jgi:hypothetical protein